MFLQIALSPSRAEQRWQKSEKKRRKSSDSCFRTKSVKKKRSSKAYPEAAPGLRVLEGVEEEAEELVAEIVVVEEKQEEVAEVAEVAEVEVEEQAEVEVAVAAEVEEEELKRVNRRVISRRSI